jgi:hypothetical protein
MIAIMEQVADISCANELIEHPRAGAVIADQGYDERLSLLREAGTFKTASSYFPIRMISKPSKETERVDAKSVHSLRNQTPSRNDAQSAPSQHAGDQRPRRGRVPLIRQIDDGRCMGTIVRRDSQPLA